MTNLSPKNQVPTVLSILVKEWNSLYQYYIKTLDRVDGELVWTKEAIDHLDCIHDTLLDQLPQYLQQVNLDARIGQ